MKYILALTFLLYVIILPAQKQVKYSPEAYKIIKEAYQNTQVPKGYNNQEVLKTMEVEFPKLMALSPSSLSAKINDMGQCAVKDGLLKASELELINAYFSARENMNIKEAKEILQSFKSVSNKSKIMSAISNASVNESSASSSSSDRNNSTQADDWSTEDVLNQGVIIMQGAGAISGGFIGGLVGGYEGAMRGTLMGEESMRFTGLVWKKLVEDTWGMGNGGGCIPPFVILDPID